MNQRLRVFPERSFLENMQSLSFYRKQFSCGSGGTGFSSNSSSASESENRHQKLDVRNQTSAASAYISDISRISNHQQQNQNQQHRVKEYLKAKLLPMKSDY
jgi:hypothetical protein